MTVLLAQPTTVQYLILIRFMTVLYFIVMVLHGLSSSPGRNAVSKRLAENTINTIDCPFTSLQHGGGNRSTALQENVRRVNEPES